MPVETSMITVPIEADVASLAQGLDKAVPRALWSIDKRVSRCIPPQRIKLFGKHLKILPAIPCTLSGDVTRGAITLHGAGNEIVADIPVDAHVTARDVGGKLKGETADGSAMVHARIRIDLAPNWTPRGTVKLHYDWTTPPGIDLLGQRVTFTDKADEKLHPLILQLERELPAQLAKLRLRAQAETVWRTTFTSIALNDDNPPVWMRITPQKIFYGGYRIDHDRIRLDAGIEGRTETFIGKRPSDPPASPLPDLIRKPPEESLRLFVPVTADYEQLEPVVLRALTKRAVRPFVLPAVGAVMARFDRIEAYGTTGGRIAVGIDLQVWSVGTPGDVTRGRIWLTARPVNAPGSAQIGFTDLQVQGDTEQLGGRLLIALGNSPGIAALVASALQQNLSHDLDGLIAKIRKAIANRRQGDFVIRARIDRIQTGVIQPAGDGVHLPVRAIGGVDILYRPSSR